VGLLQLLKYKMIIVKIRILHIILFNLFFLIVEKKLAFSQDLDSLLRTKLAEKKFPVGLIANLKSEKIEYTKFINFIETPKKGNQTYSFDTIDCVFYLMLADIELGCYRDNIPFIIVVNTRNNLITNLYTESVKYGFFSCLFQPEEVNRSFRNTDFVAKIFNSKEFTILDTNDDGFLNGHCYDSIIKLKLYYYFGIAVKSEGNILHPHQSVIVDIDKDSIYISKLSPIIYVKTSEAFLYTYTKDMNARYSELSRYREIYYEINKRKIIRDQLSSDFLYINVDRW